MELIKIIDQNETELIGWTIFGHQVIAKKSINNCLLHSDSKLGLQEIPVVEAFQKIQTQPLLLNSRCVDYSPQHQTLYLSNPQDTIYQNGREVRRNKINDIDRFTLGLGLTTDFKIVKRFAWFPVSLDSGKTLWGQSFYRLYGTRWGSSLHSGWYYAPLYSSQSLQEVGEYYLNLNLRKY